METALRLQSAQTILQQKGHEKNIIEKEGNQQKLQKYKIAVNMCNAKRKPQGAPPPILT